MYSSLSLVLFLPITLSVSLAISLSVSSWYVSLSPSCPCLIPVCLSRSLCVSPGSVSLSVSLSRSRSVSPFLPSLLLSHPKTCRKGYLLTVSRFIFQKFCVKRSNIRRTHRILRPQCPTLVYNKNIMLTLKCYRTWAVHKW